MSQANTNDFWQTKSLAQMSRSEWEQLCDGCGRCCLQKMETDDGELHYTRIACRLLGHDGRCSDYARRLQKVPDCTELSLDVIEVFEWLPATCAYRLLANGQPLPEWHPLRSGTPTSVVEAGMSVAGKVISEQHVHPNGWDEHIITWVE